MKYQLNKVCQYRGAIIVIKEEPATIHNPIGYYANIDNDEGIGFPVEQSIDKAMESAQNIIDYILDEKKLTGQEG